MRSEITNLSALEYVLGNCELPAEIAEKIQNIYDSYKKKSSKVSKKTQANRDENEVLMDCVLKVLADGKAKSVSEIMKADEVLAELSNQKVTYLVRTLVERGAVVKTKDKKTSLFSIFIEENTETKE